jgi:hypothetical protein
MLRNRRCVLVALAAAGVVMVPLWLAGCSSASPGTAAAGAVTSSPAPATPAVMSSAQGTQICRDLLAWSKVADNQDQPRFTQTLVNDVSEAGSSQLGTDMGNLESGLETENTLPLLPGPPGQPSDAQIVDDDCQQYGVSIPLWASS